MERIIGIDGNGNYIYEDNGQLDQEIQKATNENFLDMIGEEDSSAMKVNELMIGDNTKNYEQKYKDAIERAKKELSVCGSQDCDAARQIFRLFPELKEDKDEKIRKGLIENFKWFCGDFPETTKWGKDDDMLVKDIITWLEKQGKQKAYCSEKDERIRKAIIALIEFGLEDKSAIAPGYNITKEEAIGWLEKQGEQKSVDKAKPKLSEEEQNRFAKGVLSNCALSFINYLDAHKYEGKMCVSNGECEDIENAFHNAMWDRLHRYYCKYIEKKDEKPQGKSALDAIKEEKVDNANSEFKAKDWYVSKVDGKIHNICHSDKDEPKFKIGDWIIRSAEAFKHNTYLIKEVKDYYVCEELKGRRMPFTFDDVHKNFKLWDITDAKDGDVLSNGEIIVIFKHFEEPSYWQHIVAYIGLDTNGNIQVTDYTWNLSIDKTKPATKEQRDTLFAKMRDAGYVWDSEKKELKKIETKGGEK